MALVLYFMRGWVYRAMPLSLRDPHAQMRSMLIGTDDLSANAVAYDICISLSLSLSLPCSHAACKRSIEKHHEAETPTRASALLTAILRFICNPTWQGTSRRPTWKSGIVKLIQSPAKHPRRKDPSRIVAIRERESTMRDIVAAILTRRGQNASFRVRFAKNEKEKESIFDLKSHLPLLPAISS